MTASVARQTDIHTDTHRDRQTDRHVEMRAKCPFRDVTNSGRIWRKSAGKRCLEREQHLVPVPTMTPTSSAGPTKLIVTPYLQFTQLNLVLVTTLTPTSSAGPTKLIDSYPPLAVHTAEAG